MPIVRPSLALGCALVFAPFWQAGAQPAVPLSPPPRPLGAPAMPSDAARSYVRPGNVIGTGQSLPTSNQSSNITSSDTQSDIAPRLPAPPLDENAPPVAFLRSARASLVAGRTGEAQEALERAESRALDRSVRPSTAGTPSGQPLVRQIAEARGALSTNDRARGVAMIDAAIRAAEAGVR